MYLRFEVNDDQAKSIGSTKLALDFRSHMWSVAEDKAGAWKRVSSGKLGKFEVKEWGVMWLWDKARNIAILYDTPKSGTDLTAVSGQARLYAPVDDGLKDSIINWTLDPGSAGKASMVMHSPLPFDRAAYIKRLNLLFPAPYGTLNNDLLTDSLRKDDPKVLSSPGKYTTCGSLPGFISKQVALSKGLKGDAFTRWVETYSLNGTWRVREIGVKLGCWVESAPDKRPKPGDIYALLDHGKTNKKNDGISHVGVFEREVGSNWSTFDLGQAGGFDGAKNTRDFKPASCELWGESNQGGGYRTVAGWVDLERYFKV